MAEAVRAEAGPASVLDSGALARWLAPTSQSRLERITTELITERPELVEDDADPLVERALMVSIGARGVLEPLLLRPCADGFQVVQGARRLVAARRLTLCSLPAIVRELSDVEAMIAGPWQSLLRRGLHTSEAPLVTAKLLRAGLSAAEVCALVAAAPHLPVGMPPGASLPTPGLALPASASPLLPTLATFRPPNRRRGVAA